MRENWIEIKNFPGYSISDKGRVKGVRKNILKPVDGGQGYFLDNNRSNNNVENLSWGTYSENNQYMYDCKRHPLNLTDETREKAYMKRRSPVKAINIITGENFIFVSQHDAARQLNVSQQHIWGVLNGYRKSTRGHYFEYLNKGDSDD